MCMFIGIFYSNYFEGIMDSHQLCSKIFYRPCNLIASFIFFDWLNILDLADLHIELPLISCGGTKKPFI